MSSLERWHPITLLIYFAGVLVITMSTMHPMILIISLLGALFLFFLNNSIKEVFKSLAFFLPVVILSGIINTFYNRVGVTVWFYINDKPVTQEAFFYGLALSGLVVMIMLWFKNYNDFMTSEKFIYVFGKFAPKISLVISMATNFIPEFIKQIKEVNKVQKTMALYSDNGVRDRVRGSFRVFVSVLSWSLEDSITKADAMKARGYGLSGKSTFSIYKFRVSDGIIIVASLSITICVFISIMTGKLIFYYQPIISQVSKSQIQVSVYILMSILSFLPAILEVKERIRWKLLRAKN